MALWPKKSKTEADSAEAVAPPPPPAFADGGNLGAAMAPNQPEPPAATGAPGVSTTAAPQPALSAEELQKRAAASKHLMMSFGEIVSVLMRSPQFRQQPISDIEALVVPAVMTGQFVVAEAQSKSQGFVTPVAVALWASVSDEVDQRLSQDLDQPFKLAVQEWRSGPHPWIVMLAGDRRVLNPMLKQLQDTTLKGRPLKMRVQGQDGKVTVAAYRPTEVPPAQQAS